MQVRLQLRGLHLAREMIVYFFGYCGLGMVHHNFNRLLPPNRRIDPRGAVISIKNGYLYAGRSEAVAFGKHIEEVAAGEFAEMSEEYKRAGARSMTPGAWQTGAVPGFVRRVWGTAAPA